MTRSFRCGLIVGKFAPPHLGHQFLIDTARTQCDELVILSYAVPEHLGFDAARRRRWLEMLYPQTIRLVVTDDLLVGDDEFNRVPPDDAGDDVQRHFTAHVVRRYIGRTIDAVFTSEAYGDGFARDLTRRQRDFDPNAPDVHHVLLDLDRSHYPISARSIRDDVHGQRRWLDPRIYADFIERVALLGGESSGKSTLAAALAASCQTAFVAEYGRQRWHEKRGQLTREDVDEIAIEQIAREDAATLKAHRYVFCDTTPLTTLFYSRDLFGEASATLESLAARDYHHYVLCDGDFPFVQDGTRRDAAFRTRQQQWYRAWLDARGIPYVVASGSVAQRVDQVRAWLTSA